MHVTLFDGLVYFMKLFRLLLLVASSTHIQISADLSEGLYALAESNNLPHARTATMISSSGLPHTRPGVFDQPIL